MKCNDKIKKTYFQRQFNKFFYKKSGPSTSFTIFKYNLKIKLN